MNNVINNNNNRVNNPLNVSLVPLDDSYDFFAHIARNGASFSKLIRLGEKLPDTDELFDFQDKMNFLEQFTESVSLVEFYRELFPAGSFERKGHPEDCRSNGLIIAKMDSDLHHTFIVYDELENLEKFEFAEFATLVPVSYVGKRRFADNARYMHAMAFDIDGVSLDNLQTMFHQFEIGLLPRPTFIVNSGHGVHLYYVFEEPIALFKPVRKTLKEIKFALTTILWSRFTSSEKEVQYQGIFQPFRLPGSVTKFQNTITLEAFRVGEKTSLYELLAHLRYQSETIDLFTVEPIIQRDEKNAKSLHLYGTEKTKLSFNSKEEKIRRIKSDFDISDLSYRSRLSLREAEQKYPEWYYKRIVQGDQSIKKWKISAQKGHNGDELYQWWKKRIFNETVVGRRYFSIMALAIYAIKCDVDYETLLNDAMALRVHFNGLENANKKDPFTEDDVMSAISAYDDKYVTFPRKDIEWITKISMPANKRNGLSRSQNLELARLRQVQLNEKSGIDWRNGNGRKTKEDTVSVYIKKNPGLSVSAYAKALNVSRTTIYKYLKP